MVLLVEPSAASVRATVYLHRPNAPPLAITVNEVCDAQWGFLQTPRVRVVWRFAAPLDAVRFATVRAFSDNGPVQTVRVELDIAGALPPAFALEGTSVNLGPLPRPMPSPVVPNTPRVLH